jgi:hypothetical protein
MHLCQVQTVDNSHAHERLHHQHTPEELQLVDIADCIKEFNPFVWPLTCYENWCDYRFVLKRDEYLHKLLTGDYTETCVCIHGHRSAVAADCPYIDRWTGITHVAIIPDANHDDYIEYAKHLVELLDIIGIETDTFTSDSIAIKLNSVRAQECIQTIRLLMRSNHKINEPIVAITTFQQLYRFITESGLALIDGTFLHVSEPQL